MEIVALIIALIGIGDIVSFRVRRLSFAAENPGAKSWNVNQRTLAQRYWLGRCGGEALLLVAPGLLGFFQVLPAWFAVVGLALYVPTGLWMLRWVQRAIPRHGDRGKAS